jgi:hypothetical protein
MATAVERDVDRVSKCSHLVALPWCVGQLPQRGFSLREIDVFGNDRHACAISVMGAHRDGVDVSTRVVSLFTFDAGKQTERWLYPDDPDAWRAIFDG